MIEDNYVNSIVGPGSLFSGDLEVAGLVRIDGDYSGVIRKASRVLVGSTGRADAVIHAAVVVVGGAFNGTIRASERVVLLSGSLVLGSVNAPRLLVEPGAMLGCSLGIHQDADLDRADRSGEALPRQRRTFLPARSAAPVAERP